MDKITLSQKSDLQDRIALLKAFFDQSDVSVKHVTNWRQRNMNVALVVFFGLLSFGIKQEELSYQLYSSISIIAISSIFTFWDRNLHKQSHVLLATRDSFGELMAQIINNPDENLSFYRYRFECEKEAEWISFQPVVYYLLILSGILSIFAFLIL